MAQKNLSLKLDDELFVKLEKFCLDNGVKRNRVINEAIDLYIKNEEASSQH